MDADSFVISVHTKDIIKNLKNLEDLFDFSNLNENHQLFSNQNKNVIGEFKIGTPKIIWNDEFVCLRSNAYSFKSKDDNESKNK